MYKYQILIEYVGTNYRGWQIQKKGQTIQGVLQDKISKLLKEKITVIGSGRTDAGVHAISQSAHFECKNLILDKDKFLKSINHFLKNKMISVLNLKKKIKNFTPDILQRKEFISMLFTIELVRPCFIMIEAGI